MSNLKEINFKSCTCYYLDATAKIIDFDIDNIL